MGLRWRHGHPELIVVGMDPVDAHHLLHDLVERIEDGEVARTCGEGSTSLRALQVRLDQLDSCDICFDRQRALERPCSASALAAVRHPEPTA